MTIGAGVLLERSCGQGPSAGARDRRLTPITVEPWHGRREPGSIGPPSSPHHWPMTVSTRSANRGRVWWGAGFGGPRHGRFRFAQVRLPLGAWECDVPDRALAVDDCQKPRKGASQFAVVRSE
jgi:hypothetical protein